jgi:hypothetical protein
MPVAGTVVKHVACLGSVRLRPWKSTIMAGFFGAALRPAGVRSCPPEELMAASNREGSSIVLNAGRYP